MGEFREGASRRDATGERPTRDGWSGEQRGGATPGGARPGILSRDLVLVMAAAFFYMGSQMLATPLIVGFSTDIGVAAALTGLIAGAMNIVALVCRPACGRIAERVDKRRVVIVGSAALTCASLGYAAATSGPVITVARIVSGVGFALVSVCLSTWVAELVPRERIGSGMAVYGTVNALAMAVGPAAGIQVQERFGYRAAFVVAACLAALIGVMVLFVRRGSAPHADAAVSSGAGTAGTGGFAAEGTAGTGGLAAEGAAGTGGLAAEGVVRAGGSARAEDVPAASTRAKDVPVASSGRRGAHTGGLATLFAPRAVPIAVILMLFAIPYCATQSYLVTYVGQRASGVSSELFFPVYAAALLAMRVLMRNLFDRLSFRAFLVICSASLVGTCACLTLLSSNGWLLCAAVLMAGAYGLMSSAAQSHAIVVAGPGHAGRANATYYAGLDLGMSLGPMLGGVLLDALGTTGFYPALALCVPVAWVVWAVASSHEARRADD